jgi:hypothetical protein
MFLGRVFPLRAITEGRPVVFPRWRIVIAAEHQTAECWAIVVVRITDDVELEDMMTHGIVP